MQLASILILRELKTVGEYRLSMTLERPVRVVQCISKGYEQMGPVHERGGIAIAESLIRKVSYASMSSE